MLKKVLALLTALAIVFSMGTVTVFAEGEVGGTGDTTYVKTDEFAVILPTAENWKFYLDPQGLIGATRAGLLEAGNPDKVATAGQLEPYAGKIISGDYAPVAVNLSSYEMTLGVDIKVIGDATTVADEADLTGTENEILLNALLAETVATSGTTFATSGNTVEVPLDTDGQTLGFVLEHPEYVFAASSGSTSKYEYKLGTGDDKDGYGTQIQLGGLVNKGADWTDFVGAGANKSVEIEAKFTLTKALEADLTALENSPYTNAYGYIGATATTVVPGITTVGFTAAADGAAGTSTSTKIDLTFDQSVSLVAGDVTIADGTGAAVAGTLSGVGTAWSIALTSVTTQGNVIVTVANDAYSFTDSPATVAVYKGLYPQAGFISGGNTNATGSASGKVNANITVSFFTAGKTVESAKLSGTTEILGSAVTADEANNKITFKFSSSGTKSVTIKLVGDPTEYVATLTVSV